MRWRGVNHVEFSVINNDESIKFYDRMFGCLGYVSLWTLDVGHRSTYYLARPPVPHSFIGIQPATSDQPLNLGLAPLASITLRSGRAASGRWTSFTGSFSSRRA